MSIANKYKCLEQNLGGLITNNTRMVDKNETLLKSTSQHGKQAWFNKLANRNRKYRLVAKDADVIFSGLNAPHAQVFQKSSKVSNFSYPPELEGDYHKEYRSLKIHQSYYRNLANPWWLEDFTLIMMY